MAKKFPGSTLDFFEDRDCLGYTFEQREGYMQLRPQLLDMTYDILILKDFSRFSRRNSKGLVELEDLRDAGLRIISIGDSIDYPTYDDWTAIQFRFLINEMPVTDTSKKVIQRRQNEGKWICSVPYGYIMTNHKTMAFEVDAVNGGKTSQGRAAYVILVIHLTLKYDNLCTYVRINYAESGKLDILTNKIHINIKFYKQFCIKRQKIFHTISENELE